MSLFFGDLDGANIYIYGVGLTQVGDDYEAFLETWDAIPAGETGDVVFRTISASFSYTNGYNIGITPIVDGVPLNEFVFTGSGSGTNGQAQAFFAQRGTRLAVQLRTLSRAGDIELYNLQWSGLPLRSWP